MTEEIKTHIEEIILLVDFLVVTAIFYLAVDKLPGRVHIYCAFFLVAGREQEAGVIRDKLGRGRC